MTRWEYKFFKFEYDMNDDPWTVQEQYMNGLGSQGWNIIQRDVGITDVPKGNMVLTIFAKRKVHR